ncbi:glycosyltransferase [Pseudanabaena mucicola]|uniref:Glycosyltransferase n=1 Tax=Pseudanabaena mucicola FACHB-723 TaxID=2692860 RepID=A0ABR7ZVA5_9CYAN|nr:glycosyltransferase [Pseudanabaena mucicola]MBD2187727.1 glycosyltransferase [Pseudanabaena mucicola FACHB-723]
MINNEQEYTQTESETLIPKRTLLCISHVFPPKINPLANRVSKLLLGFQKEWNIIGLTDTENAFLDNSTKIHFVKAWTPQLIIDVFNKLKLGKFLDIFIWPDKYIFWILPALIKGYQIVKQEKPDVILVFMMPYSASIIGIILKWLTGVPLIFNLNDSITCTDMHAATPTWIHHWLELCLEYLYGRHANALVYVSEVNLEIAKKRQSIDQQHKFHLIRCGIDPSDYNLPINNEPDKSQFQSMNDSLDIIYTGGMNGWYEFLSNKEEKNYLKQLYRYWMGLGKHIRAKVDYRSSSPVFIGKAMQKAIAQNPSWQDKLHLKIYGNGFSDDTVNQVLEIQGLKDLVNVFGKTPHSQVIQIARQADLLLLTLPARPDGNYGGRISVKTYEYLMTDRPILAAIPKGENWNYLNGKAGVWIVDPMDIDAMCEVINLVFTAKLSGSPLRFDRTASHEEMSYTRLTENFLQILNTFKKSA